MLHLGTLIPVLMVLYREVFDLFKKPFNKLWYLILATIPAGIMGIVFSKVVDLDTLFANNAWLLSITFLLTAGEMLYSEHRCKKVKMLNEINTKTNKQ